jgi:hypothetical protein
MHRVHVNPDNLDEENRRFEQASLRQPLFLNSLPKSGSHLLRNIVRMFVPVERQYQREFIQHPILFDHLAAFDAQANLLSWGHLPFSDAAVIELKKVRKVLLVRDPYSWVLARTRFFLSSQFRGNLDHLKSGTLSVDELMNLVIFGIFQKLPALAEIYTHHAVAWLGTDVHLVRYEELTEACRGLDGAESDGYFAQLFDRCGIDRPDDWRERVRIGSSPQQSGTARENLTVPVALPDDLPEMQRRLVDYAAPGLRQILGYA